MQTTKKQVSKGTYYQWCSGKYLFGGTPSLPLEVGPLFEARRSGGALKLPQRVRAEPGHQTHFAAF